MSKVGSVSNEDITNESVEGLARPHPDVNPLKVLLGYWLYEQRWVGNKLADTGRIVYIGVPTKRSVSIHNAPFSCRKGQTIGI